VQTINDNGKSVSNLCSDHWKLLQLDKKMIRPRNDRQGKQMLQELITNKNIMIPIGTEANKFGKGKSTTNLQMTCYIMPSQAFHFH